MDLTVLAERLRAKGLTVIQIGDAEVSGISSDSRTVKHGELFAALPGLTVDGNKFDWAALAQGASAILTSKKSEQFPAQLIVSDVHKALGIASGIILNSRVDEQFSVGVTGTNGKTSICFLVAQAISYLDGKAVYGGTLGLKVLKLGKESEDGIDTNTTTPETVEFHRYLGAHPDSKGFAVEISSMALDQKRLCGLELDVVVFSNLTRDHLDYHKTLKNYFEAKKNLFLRDLKDSKKKQRVAILNVKHENLRQFAEELKNEGFKLCGYSTDHKTESDYPLTKHINYSLSLSGAEFELEYSGKDITLTRT